MRETHNQHTLNNVLRYIKARNRDGILRESMMKIGEGTGYSNATIHRALQTLQKEGEIEIIPAQSKKEPYQIKYLGSTEDDIAMLLKEASEAIDVLEESTSRVNQVMLRLQEQIAVMQRTNFDEQYIQLH